MNAADVMSSNVITVHPDTPIEKIADVLLTNHISAVPVVGENGALLGIVSEGDLIHRVEAGTELHRSWWLELLTGKQALAREFVKSHGRKASDLMTRSVVTVKPTTPLGEVARLLEKHRIKRVPVVDNGIVVGIVSRANLVQAIVRSGIKAAEPKSIDDTTLHDNVTAALAAEAWADPPHINVIVRNGTVELWGFVESEAEKQAARIAVEVLPGVRNVVDKLVVGQMLSAT